MNNILLNNIRQLKISFFLVIVLGMIFQVIGIIGISQSSALVYPIEQWIHGSRMLDFFFPLLSSLPFCWALYVEQKNKYLDYVGVRIKRDKYIKYKFYTAILVSFSAIFIIYFLSLIFSLYIIKPKVISPNISPLMKYLWGYDQINHPILFGFVWCLWKGIIASIICLFGMVLSLYIRNIFVISITPFIYCILENFITGMLNIPEYSIYTSFILNRLNPIYMSWDKMMVGVISLVIVIVCVSIILYKKYKER